MEDHAHVARGGVGYYQRERVSPRDGVEPQRWPHLDDNVLFLQNASETSKLLGLNGVEEAYLFGRRGRIEELVGARTAKRVEQQRRLALELAKQRDKLVRTAEGRAREAMERSRWLDERAAAVHEKIASAIADRQRLDEELQRLTPAERGGDHEGKEAVVAAAGVGTMDAATFILAIDAVGGEEWVRYAIAAALVFAYTTAVVVAGRMLAGVWRRVQRRTAIAMTLGVGMLVVLGAIVGGTFLSLGDFRGEAIRNIDLGQATNPSFLVYGQTAAALAAALSFGFLRLSRRGAELRDSIAATEARIAAANAEAAELERQAAHAAAAANEIVVEAESAASDGEHRGEELAALIAEEEADGQLILTAARVGYAEGWREFERARAAIRPLQHRLTPAQQESLEARLAKLRADVVPVDAVKSSNGDPPTS